MSVSPLRAVATTAVLAVLLAGCGGAPEPAGAPSSTPAPSTSATPTTTVTPSSTAATPSSTAATPRPATTKPQAKPVALLPWPTTNQARLQAAVDKGTDPWLLDPTDLALSYVTAIYNWTAADASPAAGTPKATKVDVRNTDGKRRTLTVAQPGRQGNGGIWVVTADTAG